MKGCPLVPETFGEPGTCDWCGAALPLLKSGPNAGQPSPFRRWCSTKCSEAYWSNHQWNLTRQAALKRDDYKCVRCGSDGGTKRTCSALHHRGIEWPESQPWPCPKADGYRHMESIVVGALEVNHKEPRKGVGYTNGCAHHLDGVETLCRPCHVEETTKQLREWKYPNAGQPSGSIVDTLPIWGEAAA